MAFQESFQSPKLNHIYSVRLEGGGEEAAKRNELGWGIKTHTILARGHRDDALAKQRRFGGKGKRQQKNPL